LVFRLGAAIYPNSTSCVTGLSFDFGGSLGGANESLLTSLLESRLLSFLLSLLDSCVGSFFSI